MVNMIKPGLVDGKPNAEIQKAFEEEERVNSSEAALAKVAAAQERSAEMGEGAGGFFSMLADFGRRMIPPNVIEAAASNGQMLGLIFFSVLFAIAITQLPKNEMKTLREFFQSLNDVMIVLTKWIMALAPIGVFALLLPVV